MIEFLKHAQAAGPPAGVAILSGTFHPPTCAHLALGRAALEHADEVLFVLPRALPHKRYEDVGFEERAEMLRAAVTHEPRFSAGISDGGLFIEIAREARAAYGRTVKLYFICGRDAAERIVNWDYGRTDAIREQLEEFDLAVAARRGEYEPPEWLRAHIHPLLLDASHNEVSATEVRRRIAQGEPWEALVPPSIHDLIRRYYRPGLY